MSTEGPAPAPTAAPGTERPRRYLPKLRYELIGCGLHGHELLGTDAAELPAGDNLFARESGGLRWYRCLRCDSWVVLTPAGPAGPALPAVARGNHPPAARRPLRDRYVLRLIAIDRVLHFLVLSALAAAVFLFAGNKAALNADFTRILHDLQGGLGGPMVSSRQGIVHDLQRLFAVSIRNLYLLGIAIAAYAVLEGVEAIGLWLGRRWAEYLTFVATVVFVPYEIYELTKSVTALKVLTLVINLAIVAYLLFSKRLFGLRGGGRAERAEYDADVGWPAIERATPQPFPAGPAPRSRAPGRRRGRGCVLHVDVEFPAAGQRHAQRVRGDSFQDLGLAEDLDVNDVRVANEEAAQHAARVIGLCPMDTVLRTGPPRAYRRHPEMSCDHRGRVAAVSVLRRAAPNRTSSTGQDETS